MISTINTVYNTEFDVIGGEIQPSSPVDPVFVYTGWKSSEVVTLLSGKSATEYARDNDPRFMEPYNTNVMEDRSFMDVDSYLGSFTPTHSKELDYRNTLIHDKPIIQVDGLFECPSKGMEYYNLDSRVQLSPWDIMDGLAPSNSNHLIEDYKRISLLYRTMFDNRQLKNFGGLSIVNGPYTVQDPDPVEGDLYKVFGTVQQMGAVPSYPTNVMIVNRSTGSLSTISVTPDPQGRFVKYYKDLPLGTTFMVIGLWNPEQDPYFEPVIVDRIVATKI